MSVYLATFGDGDRRYQLAGRRLIKSARNLPAFAGAAMFTISDLVTGKPALSQRDLDFINKNRKGFGYWLWKPIVILRALSMVPKGSVVVYLDAGCILNSRKQANKRFSDYLSLTRDSGHLAFRLNSGAGQDFGFRNEEWCKEDTLRLLDTPDTFRQQNQVQAGIQLMTQNVSSLALLWEWRSLSTAEQYHHIDDSPSNHKSSPAFREHRADQSIFSLLYDLRGFISLPDETFFAPDWRSGAEFPIWAARWTYSLPFSPVPQINKWVRRASSHVVDPCLARLA